MVMKFKEFLRKSLFYISVPRCVGCGEALEFNEEAFCKKCLFAYEQAKTRECSVCMKRLPECRCSNSYLFKNGVKTLVKKCRYRGCDNDNPFNKLLFSLKQDYRADVIRFVARELEGGLRPLIESYPDGTKFIITNVPRRKRAIVEYGYDHSYLLARELSDLLGIECLSFVKSHAKRSQKSTRRDLRQQNARFSLKRNAPLNLVGTVVILVDDIVTTGASMGACVRIIKLLHPKRIIGCTVSIAYSDRDVPLI